MLLLLLSLVYVIKLSRGQLRILNFSRIFKALAKFTESRSDEGNLETFEKTTKSYFPEVEHFVQM